jgi:hypothetical protein
MGTAGQAITRAATGGLYQVYSGFWSAGAPVLAAPLPGKRTEILQLAVASANPARAEALIVFELPDSRTVRLAIYSSAGRLVRTLVDRTCEAGPHEIEWDGAEAGGRRVATGIYFVRIQAGPDAGVAKLAVLQ